MNLIDYAPTPGGGQSGMSIEDLLRLATTIPQFFPATGTAMPSMPLSGDAGASVRNGMKQGYDLADYIRRLRQQQRGTFGDRPESAWQDYRAGERADYSGGGSGWNVGIY